MGQRHLWLGYGGHQALGFPQGVGFIAKKIGGGTDVGLAQLVQTFIERL